MWVQRKVKSVVVINDYNGILSGYLIIYLILTLMLPILWCPVKRMYLALLPDMSGSIDPVYIGIGIHKNIWKFVRYEYDYYGKHKRTI